MATIKVKEMILKDGGELYYEILYLKEMYLPPQFQILRQKRIDELKQRYNIGESVTFNLKFTRIGVGTCIKSYWEE